MTRMDPRSVGQGDGESTGHRSGRRIVPWMNTLRRHAWLVFVFFALLATLFGIFPGGWFEEDADLSAALLTATYAVVAVVLTVSIAVKPLRAGESWAWWALWVWPVFFVVHGAAFFVVDLVFAALGAGALMLTRPRSASPG